MKLCIVTHKVALGDGQGRVNYEVAWKLFVVVIMLPC
jgi:hypothetical protein